MKNDKTIRVLIWIQFLLIVFLILNHMMRGLDWIPISFLLIPSISMLLLEG